MASRRRSKKDKIILLLKRGETSPIIIENRTGCSPRYVSVVKREFRRSQEAR